MKVSEIAKKIQDIVPLQLAQEWDNVGLLIGDTEQQVGKILMTVDITAEVFEEAARYQADMILSYHPIIWEGLKKITNRQPKAVVYDIVRSGIAVFSVHTALDVVIGGVNDGLAEMIGIKDSEPLGDYVDDPHGPLYKLVVFIPAESFTDVTRAIFAAGAGRMDNYNDCGFSAEGIGTFKPLAGSKPAKGQRGKLAQVSEKRFETIVPGDRLRQVTGAMKEAHPYEVPAFDVFRMADVHKQYGLGRIGKLDEPVEIGAIIDRIKRGTGAESVGIIGRDQRKVEKAAVCAGSCGKIVDSAIAKGAQLYVTGELKHHQALAAQEADVTCLCLTHSVSERFILKKFAKQLQSNLDRVEIKISEKDHDPFIWKNI